MTSAEFRTDPMFLRNQFTGEGVFELPRLKKEEISLEKIELIGYDKISRGETDKIVHFFLDDYKFEVMWNNPGPRMGTLHEYRAVLTPEFSMYTEMPLAVQLHNTFRSRWCGAYMQSRGIKVIPTVAWGEPDSFWFCFDGIPKGSVVAVSTVGVRREKALFLQGYTELMRRIQPSGVICYGQPFEEMRGRVIGVDYAAANHLSPHKSSQPGSSYKQFIGRIVKGKGSAFEGTQEFLPVSRQPGFSVPDEGASSAGKKINFKGKDVIIDNDTFDPNFIDKQGRTNIQRMEQGLAPIGKDENSVNIHHIDQTDTGIVKEIIATNHQKKYKDLHANTGQFQSKIDRNNFNNWRKEYWKWRATHLED